VGAPKPKPATVAPKFGTLDPQQNLALHNPNLALWNLAFQNLNLKNLAFYDINLEPEHKPCTSEPSTILEPTYHSKT